MYKDLKYYRVFLFLFHKIRKNFIESIFIRCR